MKSKKQRNPIPVNFNVPEVKVNSKVAMVRPNEKAVEVNVNPPKFMTGKGIPKLNLGKKPKVLEKNHKWTLSSKSTTSIEDKI